jgi:KUP system potassium uptake protein
MLEPLTMNAPEDGLPSAKPDESEHGTHSKASLGTLTLGAIGVVYGDIGTSPIYALRETLRAVSGDGIPDRADVIGVLSVIFWSLMIIVTVKYVGFVLRADNRGEGGSLSLMALAGVNAGKLAPFVLFAGMVGASLFFGDAIITPAISVLSAVEGLKVVTPAFEPYVVIITAVILVGLFAVQSYGTGRVAGVFGPITTLWFLTIGLVGGIHIADDPGIFAALNPMAGAVFFFSHSDVALLVIGSAFLAVTGAEALYADLGHFGRKPISIAWFALVLPCLLLSYFGQGAYVLAHPEPVGLLLFEMVPGWATLPFVLLATAATVIASQAVISGAFSLVRQAIQLKLLPRMDIRHTSENQSGQIYIPRINHILLVGVLLLVFGFGSSEHLAAAYGISVTGEMLMTAFMLAVVMRRNWGWPILPVIALCGLFALIDGAYLAANLLKIAEGGWVSLAVAAMLLLIMLTWIKGTQLLFAKTRKLEVPLDDLVRSFARKAPSTVPGTAVFLTSDRDSAPTALLHSLKHYKVLHERNLILTVETKPRPRVSEEERVTIDPISDQFTRVTLRYGYMEDPHIPRALAKCRKIGLKFDTMTTSFFLSRRSLKPTRDSGMPFWQDRLFIALARSATDATGYFSLPTSRVVEIGTQVLV